MRMIVMAKATLLKTDLFGQRQSAAATCLDLTAKCLRIGHSLSAQTTDKLPGQGNGIKSVLQTVRIHVAALVLLLMMGRAAGEPATLVLTHVTVIDATGTPAQP